MGTRHMVGVVLDGDFKIAQYGQWDGYPEGQGKTVLDFLRKADIRHSPRRFVRFVGSTRMTRLPLMPSGVRSVQTLTPGGSRWTSPRSSTLTRVLLP